MKLLVTLAAAVSLLALLPITNALAQQGGMWKGGGGWGPGTPYNRMYDPGTVESVRGVVVSVDEVRPMKGMGHGIHLSLKTSQETISVHLGPSWYLENQDIAISPADEIEVKGSRVTFDGKPAIIAAEVKKGEDVLTLRDASGIPAWSGWRRKQG